MEELMLKKQYFQAIAEVMWVRPKGGMYLVGISFINVDDENYSINTDSNYYYDWKKLAVNFWKGLRGRN